MVYGESDSGGLLNIYIEVGVMKINLKFQQSVAGFLILILLHLCWLTSYGWAEMVATNAVVQSQAEIENPRQHLFDLLNREGVAEQLQQHSISQVEVVARINSLTDEEVAIVVEQIDQLPDGGNYSGGYHNIPPEGYVLGLIVLWLAVAGSISLITCSTRGAVCAIADCQRKYAGWSDCSGTWFRALTLGEKLP